MKAEFPTSIDSKVKFLDRYTVREVIMAGILAAAGWYVAGAPGAAGGIVLGALLAEFKPGGRSVDAHLMNVLSWVSTAPTVSEPNLRQFADGTVVLGDDTVLGIVQVESSNLEYASERTIEANRDTLSEMFDEVDYPVELHSRQRVTDLSAVHGASGSAVTTNHYIVVRVSDSSVTESYRRVDRRCNEIRSLLTSADLYAEQLTGNGLKSAVKQVYSGQSSISSNQVETEYGQKRVQRMLYVDDYPEELPFGWVAELLNADTSGLVDVVQLVQPVTNPQRNWMDRMLARIKSERSSSWKPSRQANLRRQERDLEDLIGVESGNETLVNYGIYIVARGDTSAEAQQTIESVQSVLKRFRVQTREPRRLNNAVQTVSPFQSSRSSQTDIVPGTSAATGFSFSACDAIEPGGTMFGEHSNGMPAVLDRFSWEAGHTSVMGKIGAGKTYWTKLLLYRSYRNYDDLEIYVIDPKKRDYGELVNVLDGKTKSVDDLRKSSDDVVRYTVDDPSRDNTERLVRAVRHVYRQASKTDRKSLVVLDEVHRIISKGDRAYQDGIQAVSALVREGRDQNIAATLVTQNANEFTRSNEGQNILRNVDCNLFFRQKDVDSQLVEFFDLSKREAVELRKLRTGSRLPFSEALIHGPVNTRLRIEATENEHHVIEHGERTDAVLAEEAGIAEPDSVEAKERTTDGGTEVQSNDSAHESSETGQNHGLFALVALVFGGSIKLFEALLLAGYPLSALLHRQQTLRTLLPGTELPLNGTLIDLLAVWTVLFVVIEVAWVILLSIDIWFAQS